MVSVMLCVAGIVIGATADQSPGAPDAAAKPVPAWQLVRHGEKETTERKEYLATLEIPDLSLSLALMNCSESPSHEWAVDKDTLGVEWLEPDRILWIHWCTTRMGNGNYRAEAHVILSLAVSPAKELLREAFMEWGKGGINDYEQTNATYRLERSSPVRIVICRTVTHDVSETDENAGVPLSVIPGWGVRLRHYRIVQESQNEIEPEDRLGKHVHCWHRAWLDLDATPLFKGDIPEYKTREYTLQEVAEFLVLFLCPRYGKSPGMGSCLPEERDKMEVEILKRNHGLAPDKSTRAKIAIPLMGFKAIIEPLSPEADYYPFR
jgi:hypothetical protein